MEYLSKNVTKIGTKKKNFCFRLIIVSRNEFRNYTNQQNHIPCATRNIFYFICLQSSLKQKQK